MSDFICSKCKKWKRGFFNRPDTDTILCEECNNKLTQIYRKWLGQDDNRSVSIFSEHDRKELQ